MSIEGLGLVPIKWSPLNFSSGEGLLHDPRDPGTVQVSLASSLSSETPQIPMSFEDRVLSRAIDCPEAGGLTIQTQEG